MATGARDYCRTLQDLHAAAARKLGYKPANSVLARFSPDHLKLVRSVFPSVEVFEFEDAFRFPAAEPAVRYYATGMVDGIENAPHDGRHRRPLISEMEKSLTPDNPARRRAGHPQKLRTLRRGQVAACLAVEVLDPLRQPPTSELSRHER